MSVMFLKQKDLFLFRGFALAIPSAQNADPLAITTAVSFHPLGLSSDVTFLAQMPFFFPDDPSKIISLNCLLLYYLLIVFPSIAL